MMSATLRMAARAVCFAGVLGGLVALGGCVEPPPPPDCPSVRVLQDPGTLTRFREGDGRDITDILFQAEFSGVSGDCIVDDNEVSIDFAVRIAAQRGPADTEKRADMNIFMAVQAPDRQILSREEFQIQIPFDGNQTRVVYSDEFEGRIPLPAGESAGGYTVYLGFVLTREELQFNREQLVQ